MTSCRDKALRKYDMSETLPRLFWQMTVCSSMDRFFQEDDNLFKMCIRDRPRRRQNSAFRRGHCVHLVLPELQAQPLLARSACRGDRLEYPLRPGPEPQPRRSAKCHCAPVDPDRQGNKLWRRPRRFRARTRELSRSKSAKQRLSLIHISAPVAGHSHFARSLSFRFTDQKIQSYRQATRADDRAGY